MNGLYNALFHWQPFCAGCADKAGDLRASFVSNLYVLRRNERATMTYCDHIRSRLGKSADLIV